MARSKYILSIDQGTTSSRAIIFDEHGEIKSIAQTEYAQLYPQEGWVEQAPLEIYSSVASTMSEVLARCGLNRTDIAAIGITNQRETTIVWNRVTGMPVYNAIVWQCRRTADMCDKLRADGYADMIYNKTGLTIDAYFSATKLKWILDNVPSARKQAEKGELLFGTVDTYLMWKLSSGEIFATDYTNASRTMLFNIHTLDWDDELLKLFGIPRQMLPEVRPSGSLFGYTDSEVIGARIPIAGVAGDQQAALFGQKCFKRGMLKCTFGTGCFLLMNTGNDAIVSRHGLVTTLAAGTSHTPTYALEGSVFMGGAVVQWMRDQMKLVNTAAETEISMRAVDDTLGVYIVPAFVGLGAPYWDAYARGTITGLTRGVTRDHFIRAGLESIAYQVNDVLVAMEKDSGVVATRLSVDGGASANNALMQFMANISGIDVIRPKTVETTALGAAFLAGLTVGVYDPNGLENLSHDETLFASFMADDTRKELLDGWAAAVKKARG
ncbi:MAG: glycerol kinase GlpK [Clostridiales bacterium]|nr:glycerol kinase GlpK [Clostridiales bacterium]